jgi:RNA recognition motif-containing protein
MLDDVCVFFLFDVAAVNMPRDKITGAHLGYAFCEFRSEVDADYAMKIMNMIELFKKTIKVNKVKEALLFLLQFYLRTSTVVPIR